MIPEEIINQILDKVDIAELISGYIHLKRSGRNFKANCPFHHEKTPSFMVSPDKQIFHCFGCGAGGNAIGFLMKHERLEFPEAVEFLAAKAGIQLSEWSSSDSGVSEAAKIYMANELAQDFYHYSLLKMDCGKDAYAYLIKRGIKDEWIKNLKIGYAPDDWSSFLNHAKKKGIDADILEKAGLVVPGRDGSHYDRFRHRVIFPISNHKGKVVGFGARVLDQTLPKYINSPETPVYNKGSHLYGFGMALEHIKKNDFVIVVEGYLDFLTPYQAGIGNIVASLGTALTTDQLRLIKRFTRNITMIFDSDLAGQTASLRGLDLAISEDFNVKVATLPVGYDPDKFIREFGAEKFLESVKTAKDFFDYKYDILKIKFQDGSAESKARIAQQMFFTIAKIPNAIAKTEYMKRLAECLDVDSQALWSEFRKIKDDSRIGTGDTTFNSKPVNTKSSMCLAEKMLLGLILDNPSLIKELQGNLKYFYSDSNAEFKHFFNLIAEFWVNDKDMSISKILNSIKEESYSQQLVDCCASVQENTDKNKCFKDCLKSVRQTGMKNRMKSLQGQIKTAQTAKDEASLLKLLNEYSGLIKEKIEV